MANIKTRERNKGSIKTIDRASVMAQHIRQSNFKIRDSTITDRRGSDNPENYAQQHVPEISKTGSRRSAAAAYEVSKETARRIHMKKDAIEIKKRKDILLRSRHTHLLYRNMLTSMESRSIQSL